MVSQRAPLFALVRSSAHSFTCCRQLGLQALLVRQRAAVEDSDIRHLRTHFFAEAGSGASAAATTPAGPKTAAPPGSAASTASTSSSKAASGPGSLLASGKPVEEVLDAHTPMINYTKAKAILRRLNIYKDKKTLRAIFGQVAGGDQATALVGFEDFVRMVDLMRDRPDISQVRGN